MRLARTPHAALPLLSVALCLSSCFGHHTSDEDVLKNETPNEDTSSSANSGQDEEDVVEEGDQSEPKQQDAGSRTADAGVRASDAGAADSGARALDAGNQCAAETDAIARLLCTAGLGGSGDINGIINGILGGGMQTMTCASETDPIARLLCGALGSNGSGLEGIISGLLGGGGAGSLLADGGIERVLTNALVEVVRGVIDDLLNAVFGRAGDAGTRNTRVDAGTLRSVSAALTNSEARDSKTRSPEQCAAVSADDVLTRLLCARQALDAISPAP
jgi:hypothetical protein